MYGIRKKFSKELVWKREGWIADMSKHMIYMD